MDWAARFIDSIYNHIGSKVYVNEHRHSVPTVMGILTIEAICDHYGWKATYDEIRKTVTFS